MIQKQRNELTTFEIYSFAYEVFLRATVNVITKIASDWNYKQLTDSVYIRAKFGKQL